ncbi:UNVERIFIED_CONTAM: hypothetical protein OHV15_08860 [Microbacterium sp. SLM126]
MARYPERFPPSRAARGYAAGLVLALVFTVAGCTVAPPVGPSMSADPSDSASTTPSPDPSSPAAEPELVPDGNAYDNLPLFTAVTERVWASPDRVAGRAYVDALVAAGFDKSAMEVTADLTTIGNPVESIQFSVLWGQQCLVGQVGPTTGDPVTVVMPVVPEDGCLIGETRAIDW